MGFFPDRVQTRITWGWALCQWDHGPRCLCSCWQQSRCCGWCSPCSPVWWSCCHLTLAEGCAAVPGGSAQLTTKQTPVVFLPLLETVARIHTVYMEVLPRHPRSWRVSCVRDFVNRLSCGTSGTGFGSGLAYGIPVPRRGSAVRSCTASWAAPGLLGSAATCVQELSVSGTCTRVHFRAYCRTAQQQRHF